MKSSCHLWECIGWSKLNKFARYLPCNGNSLQDFYRRFVLEWVRFQYFRNWFLISENWSASLFFRSSQFFLAAADSINPNQLQRVDVDLMYQEWVGFIGPLSLLGKNQLFRRRRNSLEEISASLFFVSCQFFWQLTIWLIPTNYKGSMSTLCTRSE